MDRTVSKQTLAIRILILFVCCVLFLPHEPLSGKKIPWMDASIHITAMTMAVTGLSNPVPHISSASSAETPSQPSLRSPYKRNPFNPLGYLQGHTPLFAQAVSSADAILSFFLPVRTVWYLLCTRQTAFFWFALAPPFSQNR